MASRCGWWRLWAIFSGSTCTSQNSTIAADRHDDDDEPREVHRRRVHHLGRQERCVRARRKGQAGHDERGDNGMQRSSGHSGFHRGRTSLCAQPAGTGLHLETAVGSGRTSGSGPAAAGHGRGPVRGRLSYTIGDAAFPRACNPCRPAGLPVRKLRHRADTHPFMAYRRDVDPAGSPAAREHRPRALERCVQAFGNDGRALLAGNTFTSTGCLPPGRRHFADSACHPPPSAL